MRTKYSLPIYEREKVLNTVVNHFSPAGNSVYWYINNGDKYCNIWIVSMIISEFAGGVSICHYNLDLIWIDVLNGGSSWVLVVDVWLQ